MPLTYFLCPTGWSGLTGVCWSTSSYNIISTPVKLNDYYSYNSYGCLQDACHEMGQALGPDSVQP